MMFANALTLTGFVLNCLSTRLDLTGLVSPVPPPLDQSSGVGLCQSNGLPLEGQIGRVKW